MTRNEHMKEYRRLWELAMVHLRSFNGNGSTDRKGAFEEYKQFRELMKQAQRHHGTAQMMLTKEINKLARG